MNIQLLNQNIADAKSEYKNCEHFITGQQLYIGTLKFSNIITF